MTDHPKGEDTAEFTFYAHHENTRREVKIVIKVPDDPNWAYADLADYAERKAYSEAARRLGCSESAIEVQSE